MHRRREWYEYKESKVSKRLREQLRHRREEEPLPVIIMLRDGMDDRARDLQRHIRHLGGPIRRDLPVIHGFSTVLPGRALSEIGSLEEIHRLHLDRICHPCLDIAVPSVFGDRAQAAGYSGEGVTIAILDSGIYPHADFIKPAPRITGWHDVVNRRPRPYDDHGHGTHVAGIAAGNGYASDGRFRGVAPEAKIVAVKVADSEGQAPMSHVIEGLQWVLENQEKFDIRIVNLSLGSDPSESYREDPLCQAVEQVWKAGIVVAVAAGNDGPSPGSIDTPGNDPMVITVGAVNDEQTTERDDDRLPDFSSRGPTNDGLPKPDLLAPGVNIRAPKPNGGYIDRTGTSMATPMVSGAAALLLSSQPGLTPTQVKNKLKESAEKRRLTVRGNTPGYLDVEKLLALPTDKTKESRDDRPPFRLALHRKIVHAAERELTSRVKRSILLQVTDKIPHLSVLSWLLDALI